MKAFIVGAVVVTFIGFVAYYLFWIFLVTAVVKESVSAYEKPDTTITIRNGKSDTVIVKKQASTIFK